MDVDLFDFDLPEGSIALRPASPRDEARLLVSREGSQTDAVFKDLASHLNPGDLLVFNDTKVIPARLYGRRGQAKIEVTLHMREAATEWRVFARPARKCRLGDVLEFDELKAVVTGVLEAGERQIRFEVPADKMMEALLHAGEMPLPPYIASKRAVDGRDGEDYQTIFARTEGAVAAPTAGLHFTPAVLESLKRKGIETAAVTLHVGAGTFLPVKAKRTEDHKMHTEIGFVSADVAARIKAVKKRGNRIVCVGTTSLRLLESAATDKGEIAAFEGGTDIFITPGYDFKIVDALLTNFHLPKSTLFMLVSAFAGLERMRALYKRAVESGYRFYSYGDTSLLFPSG